MQRVDPKQFEALFDAARRGPGRSVVHPGGEASGARDRHRRLHAVDLRVAKIIVAAELVDGSTKLLR
jgi:hypothetical protein